MRCLSSVIPEKGVLVRVSAAAKVERVIIRASGVRIPEVAMRSTAERDEREAVRRVAERR